MRVGVRYDAARDCLDPSDTVGVGFDGEGFQGGYYCLQRKADGAVYWATTIRELSFDTKVWNDCFPGEPPTRPPPPCFAVQCEKAPRSLCTFEQTVQEFGCGTLNGEWDEACCARQACESVDDCPESHECVPPVRTAGSQDCWPTPDGLCDCGGTALGGAGQLVCRASHVSVEED